MTEQQALDYVREHLTKLHDNPNIYADGTCNVISALEDVIIPKLEISIRINGMFGLPNLDYPRVNDCEKGE